MEILLLAHLKTIYCKFKATHMNILALYILSPKSSERSVVKTVILDISFYFRTDLWLFWLSLSAKFVCLFD